MKHYTKLNELPDLMSVEQTAEFLSVSRNTVYTWCNSGDFPSFKQGNIRRIRKEALMRWIEELEEDQRSLESD